MCVAEFVLSEDNSNKTLHERDVAVNNSSGGGCFVFLCATYHFLGIVKITN